MTISLWLVDFIWSLQDVDYEATTATKLSIAKKVFNREKDLILNSSSFQEFFSENEVLLLHITTA
jgi:4-alpha-glucanotransferase